MTVDEHTNYLVNRFNISTYTANRIAKYYESFNLIHPDKLKAKKKASKRRDPLSQVKEIYFREKNRLTIRLSEIEYQIGTLISERKKLVKEKDVLDKKYKLS